MLNYNSPYDQLDEKYEDSMENWVISNSNYFEFAVRGLLPAGSSLLEEIATAIALSINDYNDCNRFCDEYHTSPSEALCYLSIKCGSFYDKHIEKAYQRFIDGYE